MWWEIGCDWSGVFQGTTTAGMKPGWRGLIYLLGLEVGKLWTAPLRKTVMVNLHPFWRSYLTADLRFAFMIALDVWETLPVGTNLENMLPVHICSSNYLPIRVNFISFFFFFCFFLLLFYYSCPNFLPLLSSATPISYSHSQSPPYCPCPWVIYTCSLT